jgi:hypothetical protein
MGTQSMLNNRHDRIVSSPLVLRAPTTRNELCCRSSASVFETVLFAVLLVLGKRQTSCEPYMVRGIPKV